MKDIRYFLGLLLAIFVLTSCGGEQGKFRIKGKYANIRQGEFYIYSLDGGNDRLDTIKVENGAFDYTVSTLYPATYIILYPNFSEQVVFGNSGEVVTIKGDVKALRSVDVSGTPENEEMTSFRLGALDFPEDNLQAPAEVYIRENPHSRISVYLLMRYFIQAPNPNLQVNQELTDLLLAAQPDQEEIWRSKEYTTLVKNSVQGEVLPDFSVVTVKGDTLTNDSLRARCTVFNFWATWYDQSRPAQRQMRTWQRSFGDSLHFVSVSLDVSYATMVRSARVDSLDWHSICDYRAWDSPLVEALSIRNIPQMVIVSRDSQKILWRGNQTDSAKVVLDEQVALYRAFEINRKDSLDKVEKLRKDSIRDARRRR